MRTPDETTIPMRVMCAGSPGRIKWLGWYNLPAEWLSRTKMGRAIALERYVHTSSFVTASDSFLRGAFQCFRMRDAAL
jgi:hypothetical protein